MFPRVTRVYRVSVQHFFTAKSIPTAWTDRISLIQSSAGGHLDYSYFLVIMNEATFNSATQVSVWTYVFNFLGNMPRWNMWNCWIM